MNESVINFVRVPNTEVSFEIVKGFRCTSNLLYVKEEKQFYIQNSYSPIGVGYSCYVKDCLRRVHIRGEKCFIGDDGTHDHLDKADMYVNLCALNEMKTTLLSTTNRSKPREVFNDVMKK